MQIMINIPEKLYNRMKTYQGLDDTYVAVKHGTPLPKGHGRLIDADKLWDSYHNLDYDFYEALDLADAIIEADNTESEVNYGKWIPVTENLPSDLGYDWVLAQIQEDNGYLWIPMVMEYSKAKDDWYSDTSNLGWLKDHNGAFKVIRWTPLPAPYEPKESEE